MGNQSARCQASFQSSGIQDVENQVVRICVASPVGAWETSIGTAGKDVLPDGPAATFLPALAGPDVGERFADVTRWTIPATAHCTGQIQATGLPSKWFPVGVSSRMALKNTAHASSSQPVASTLSPIVIARVSLGSGSRVRCRRIEDSHCLGEAHSGQARDRFRLSRCRKPEQLSHVKSSGHKQSAREEVGNDLIRVGSADEDHADSRDQHQIERQFPLCNAEGHRLHCTTLARGPITSITSITSIAPIIPALSPLFTP